MTHTNLDQLYQRKVREAADLQAQGLVRVVTCNTRTLTVWVDGDVYWCADDEMTQRHPTTADIT